MARSRRSRYFAALALLLSVAAPAAGGEGRGGERAGGGAKRAAAAGGGSAARRPERDGKAKPGAGPASAADAFGDASGLETDAASVLGAIRRARTAPARRTATEREAALRAFAAWLARSLSPPPAPERLDSLLAAERARLAGEEKKAEDVFRVLAGEEGPLAPVAAARLGEVLLASGRYAEGAAWLGERVEALRASPAVTRSRLEKHLPRAGALLASRLDYDEGVAGRILYYRDATPERIRIYLQEENGRPVAGARRVLEARSYRFENVPPGRYRLKIYFTIDLRVLAEIHTVRVEAGGVTRLRLDLRRVVLHEPGDGAVVPPGRTLRFAWQVAARGRYRAELELFDEEAGTLKLFGSREPMRRPAFWLDPRRYRLRPGGVYRWRVSAFPLPPAGEDAAPDASGAAGRTMASRYRLLLVERTDEGEASAEER